MHDLQSEWSFEAKDTLMCTMRPEKAAEDEEEEVCADDGDDLFKALGKKLSACHNKGLFSPSPTKPTQDSILS